MLHMLLKYCHKTLHLHKRSTCRGLSDTSWMPHSEFLIRQCPTTIKTFLVTILLLQTWNKRNEHLVINPTTGMILEWKWTTETVDSSDRFDGSVRQRESAEAAAVWQASAWDVGLGGAAENAAFPEARVMARLGTPAFVKQREEFPQDCLS